MGAAFEVNKQMCDIEKDLSEAGYFRKICEGQIQARKKLIDMEEKKTVQEWRDEFAELYAKMRKELGAKDLDIYIRQNEDAPVYVSFDIKF